MESPAGQSAWQKAFSATNSGNGPIQRLPQTIALFLSSAVGALLAGVFILFRPELWRLLWGILVHPFSLGLLALSLALAAGFVFLGPAWVEERLDRLRHGK